MASVTPYTRLKNLNIKNDIISQQVRKGTRVMKKNHTQINFTQRLKIIVNRSRL